MYIKTAIGHVLGFTENNYGCVFKKSLSQNHLLKYWAEFLKTVYLIQCMKGDYKSLTLRTLSISDDAFLIR